MAVSSSHLYVKVEPIFLKVFQKNECQTILCTLMNLQFESRVLSLFQVVGSHSRKVKAAG